MTSYFNSKLVDLSFKRLAPVTNTGKKPKERTSALMYFLAFDAAAKKLDCCPLDLNPRSLDGKNNRQEVELEFVKLVRLKNSSDMKVRQVLVLGKVETGGTAPEKRISSNFLTVPLKKASEAAKVHNYPNRPAPLLKMGMAATGVKWGVDYHNDWRTNLPKFLSETKGSTPFSDLAIFVCRNEKVPKSAQNYREALAIVLKEKFSEDLAEFWSKRIEAEKVFMNHGDDSFRNSYNESLTEEAFAIQSSASDKGMLNSLEKPVLVERVLYLEGLLDAQEIEYQSIIK
jgi:hypothetical protein